ncbi:hypothetical protein EMPS_02387 [Entomortierella parvispora]|uniref:Aldehyde dehydrogenase n=1 Tax=Entomortierella parvispora TaxID=205924 RepID=A0A9P3H4R4_9FUNG|nr:hypothetical protein EMPS_02387 [Entomortierella parvispora]
MVSEHKFTPVSDIPKIVAASRATFLTHRTQSLEFRKEQLRALYLLVSENSADLTGAIRADLNRPSDFEIPTCLRVIKSFIENLESLVEPQKATGLIGTDKSFVRLSPLGTVLIIGAWNFPIMLVIEPLAGAIAAGNTAIVKPSEVSVTSDTLLTRLLRKYMDPSVVAVVNGGAEETTVLLKERFDHIFYTGGVAVAKIVMQAAAKNLTPVTLELGGKCPAIVTDKTDLAKAAQKIAGWKALNCGQVCLSVDYVLCPRHLQDELIKNLIGTWQHMYGKDAKQSDVYPRIITKRQLERLEKVLSVAKKENKVVYGGESDLSNRYMAPTILTDVKLEDTIMEEEIFGPLLPIIDCEDIQGAVDVVNKGEHPLALYLFSDDPVHVEKVLSETRSGGVIVNDIATHFSNHSLPFGGVGHSGIGNYHGKYSVETFSHKRAVMVRSQAHL